MERSIIIMLITLLLVSALGGFQEPRAPHVSSDSCVDDDEENGVGRMERVQYHYDHLVSARDLSIVETEAVKVWSSLDGAGLNLTGEGILIADLDTGVDWTHPDLWLADGDEYGWVDGNYNGHVDDGDGIDIDGSGDLQSDENIGIIDINNDGTLQVDMDWLWCESVADDGAPNVGETFFVANDTDGDNLLDIGEKLVMLLTPKTRYIVETDGVDESNIVVWDRETNLTSTTHTDVSGHGTAVAGILLGGQPGYRKYVGVAPGAELMMITVYGERALGLMDALDVAVALGADVIVVEAGQWVEVFMDGSSDVEQRIDELSASGKPVVVPAGNLGESGKHAMFSVYDGVPRTTSFDLDGFSIYNVYMSMLTVDSVDLTSGAFSITVPGGSAVVLHPGNGYRMWGTDSDPATGIQFRSYVCTSSRGTSMLYVEMNRELLLPSSSAFVLNVTIDDDATLHCYISDDGSGWSGGSRWITDPSNEYLVTFPATADTAIAVGSYYTRSWYGTQGAIASYSGRGPRIDGATQVSVAAPGGYDVVSDLSSSSGWASWYGGPGNVLNLREVFGGYRLFSGTSAAGPHVAGCAALMLQANQYANRSIGEIVRQSAREDDFTGSTPNEVWGHGKLNVSAAVSAALEVQPPAINSVWRNRQDVEYDESVTVVANVTEGSYLFSVCLRLGIDNPACPFTAKMIAVGDGNYTFTTPGHVYGTDVYYSVYVNDSMGVLLESDLFSYTVTDFTPPNLSGTGMSPEPVGIGAVVTVHTIAAEHVNASGLGSVYMDYTTDSWASYTTVTMSRTGEYYTGQVPGQLCGTTVGYVCHARDNAGNIADSDVFYYTIVDDHAPAIGVPVRAPAVPNSTQTVEIAVAIADESDLAYVLLGYFGGTHWTNVSMSFNGTCYTALIPALANDTAVLYMVYAGDLNNNSAASLQYGYTVYDIPVTTTITTTTTTTTSTTSTTSSMTDTSTTGTPEPPMPAPYLAAAACGMIVACLLVVLRRRSHV